MSGTLSARPGRKFGVSSPWGREGRMYYALIAGTAVAHPAEKGYTEGGEDLRRVLHTPAGVGNIYGDAGCRAQQVL